MTVTTFDSALHRAIWRWHFYAALFVVPFLVLLPASGMLMLASASLEGVVHRDLLHVAVLARQLPPSEQLDAVLDHYPQGRVTLYIPPATSAETSEFAVVPAGHSEGGHGGHGRPSLRVFVNPYSAEVLGSINPETTFYAWAKRLHGSLLLGTPGGYLVEIAAGLAVLMVITGLVLAWPGIVEGFAGMLLDWQKQDRQRWRAIHTGLGLILALPLLFFLFSGLAWTSIWGGELVQPWNSVPDQTFEAAPAAGNHKTLNPGTQLQVPWVLEQTPLPQSGYATGIAGIPGTTVDLDTVDSFARIIGFIRYRIHLPENDTSVWTISATTMAGDIQNPGAERTVHLDRYSGRILADLRFGDYPFIGKAMTTSIPIHQGDLGWWNLVLNFLLCLSVISLTIAGAIMWWKRRANGFAPPVAAPDVWRGVVVTMLVVSVCFPLAAAAMMAIIVLDWLVLARFYGRF